MQEIIQQFLSGLRQTSFLEFIAVISGIVSVWYSKKENILVYPTGLINTTVYVYLSVKYNLFGEASVNLYYTIMSIYGWIIWARKNEKQEHVLHITRSTTREWLVHLAFFLFFYVTIFFSLTYLKQAFSANTIPWGDSFASATAFTGMWLMARKKVESWYWWMATNAASIPLYFIKGLVFTSVFYVILLILSVSGLIEWIERSRTEKKQATFA